MAPVSRQATGSLRQEAIVSQKLSCDPVAVLLAFRAYNHGLKGLQKPKTYCDNSSLRSYLSPSVFTVRSGPVWRQDPAIPSPEGPLDNTCQLRPDLFRILLLRCLAVLGVPPKKVSFFSALLVQRTVPLPQVEEGCMEGAGGWGPVGLKRKGG